ncbi:glycosyltransferase family 2 protein [Intestinibacter bartlettii]|uniref:glycosyltransferase family 2 protein n=1 Tax=Intestinibacter bartlettii TaxID=261299 RepID=UPI0039A17B5A
MKLSVIVPMYNSEKYISRCIESIINQDMEDMEIILIDDGSTDNTKNIVQKYACKYENIRLISKKENEGVSIARNIGINIATGEYITFVDSDDTINNGMYKNMYRLAKENDSDLVMCSYLRKNQGSDIEIRANIENKYITYDRKYIEEKIIPTFVKNTEYGYYYVRNKIYKKKFLDDNNILFKEKIAFGEDWLFNLEVFDKINIFSYINEPYYNYFDNMGSQSKNIDRNRINLYLEGHKKNYYFVEKYNLESKYIDSRLLEEIYVYVYSLIVSKNSYKTKKDIIKWLSKNNQFLDCFYCVSKQSKFIKYILTLLKSNCFNLLNLSINIYDKYKKGVS